MIEEELVTKALDDEYKSAKKQEVLDLVEVLRSTYELATGVARRQSAKPKETRKKEDRW